MQRMLRRVTAAFDPAIGPLVDAIRGSAHPLSGDVADYNPLLSLVGDAPVVLIGEASHGTHEFYRERAAITMRLIAERGFSAVAVEADWPDAYQVNRYVRGAGDERSPDEALAAFTRFPRWMWRNTVVRDFVAALRAHNDALPPGKPRVGFYGLDLYSLHASTAAVIRYLDTVDADAARRARERYSCFEHAGDPQVYGYAASIGAIDPCEDEAVAQLVELQRRAGALARRDGPLAADDFFAAEQNARLARNAEAYYRAMYRGRDDSWNLRDTHMAETLDALLQHLARRVERPKVVVWAHNSHLGDARATEMGDRGELNLGQLTRERYGRDCVNIGLTTYTGTVTAAHDWDEPGRRRHVRSALAGSYEALFHSADMPRFLLLPHVDAVLDAQLRAERLERAIGVIYRPATERASHYFHARLSDQFDAVIHLDTTTALEPLDADGGGEEPGELPDTFPAGE